MAASVGSAPGPSPSMNRPRSSRSANNARSATHSGLWYGNETTPVPSLMCRVCGAA